MALFIAANVGFEGGPRLLRRVPPRAHLPVPVREDFRVRVRHGIPRRPRGAPASSRPRSKDAADPAYFDSVRNSFLIAGGFFLLFSLPLFLWVPEPPAPSAVRKGYIREGMRKSRATLTAILTQAELAPLKKFLIAFFLYNDAIITVIAFAAIFAAETLRMTDTDIIVFFAIVQTSAILGSFLFGFITDRIGPKRTILITLTGWVGIVIGAYFVQTVGAFYVVALFAGMAIGSTQSSSRSMMALLTPENREAEFFGFYDGLCGKSSAVLGPLVYGALSDFGRGPGRGPLDRRLHPGRDLHPEGRRAPAGPPPRVRRNRRFFLIFMKASP